MSSAMTHIILRVHNHCNSQYGSNADEEVESVEVCHLEFFLSSAEKYTWFHSTNPYPKCIHSYIENIHLQSAGFFTFDT